MLLGWCDCHFHLGTGDVEAHAAVVVMVVSLLGTAGTNLLQH